MSEAQHFYQAIGELEATLVIADDGTKFLQTRAEQYPVFIPRWLEKKYQHKLQQQVYWHVYPKAAGARQLTFYVSAVLDTPKWGVGQFILQGDWIELGQLQVWRNAVAGVINIYNWQPQLLPIIWDSAPPPDEAFWQLKAQLVDGTLQVVEAAGPFSHPPRLEEMPEFLQQQQQPPRNLPKPIPRQQRPPRPASSAKPQVATSSQTTDWKEITPVSGKLELTIKINTLPQVQQANGQCHFKIDCDGRVFQVSVKPKQWAKLETASTTYAQWVAAIAGKLGEATTDGFVLESPNIQVFERSKQVEQPKGSEVAQLQAAATEPPHVTSEPQAASETKISQTKTQTVEAAMKASEAKPDPLARPSTEKVESKPKKISKFNVEIR